MKSEILNSSNLPRRRFLKASSLIAVAALLHESGCESRPAIKIAGHKFPGYEFIFLARDEGWLNPKLVQLVESSSASDSLRALAENKVQGAMLTLDETLKARAEGIPLTVVLILDRSVGADGLLAKPDINQLNQLKGKKLGVETTATGRLFLQFALERAGLTMADVNLLNLSIDQHVQACETDKVDAVITYEPSFSQITHMGWRNLIDSRELGLIFDVLAIRSDSLQWRIEAIVNLTQAHLRAIQAWHKNPIDTSYRLARRLPVPAQSIHTLYRGLDLPDLDFNYHMLSRTNPELLNIAARISEILGYQKAMVNAEQDLFTPDYLPKQVL